VRGRRSIWVSPVQERAQEKVKSGERTGRAGVLDELVGRAGDEVSAPGESDDGFSDHRRRGIDVGLEIVNLELGVDAGRGQRLAGLLLSEGARTSVSSEASNAREDKLSATHKLLELGLLPWPRVDDNRLNVEVADKVICEGCAGRTAETVTKDDDVGRVEGRRREVGRRKRVAQTAE